MVSSSVDRWSTICSYWVVVSLYGHDRPVEDLTARARIVDAALAQFASSGPSGATMRSIAESAGVSIGLVQHHFGTKDNLRKACDERVLELVRTKVAHDAEGRLADPDVLGSLYELSAPVMPYVARAALEDDDRSAALFDELATMTAEWLTRRWPERYPAGADRTRDAAAVMAAMSMGTIVHHHQLVRWLGLDPSEPVPSPRVGLAALDVYRSMGELMASAYGEELSSAVDAYVDQGSADRSPRSR